LERPAGQVFVLVGTDLSAAKAPEEQKEGSAWRSYRIHPDVSRAGVPMDAVGERRERG
jgi:hypothetical protein